MAEHEFGKHEAPTDQETIQLLSLWLKDMGQSIKEVCPPNMGFALLLFDYAKDEKPGNMFYTSSARREDVLKAMIEFIEKNSEKS